MQGTSTGLAENIAGLLCYVLGWITGLVFLLIECKNEFVRLHAMQSVIVFGALTIVESIVIVIGLEIARFGREMGRLTGQQSARKLMPD